MIEERLAHYIGRTVRRLRLERDFTLQALADESGISKSYLGDIEKGRKNPTTDVLESIARALAVPSRQLLYQAALEEGAATGGQLTLEEDRDEEMEVREIQQLSRRLGPRDRRLLIDLARRLSK